MTTTVESSPIAVVRAGAPRSVRVIARLDVKGPNVIKGVRLEGLRIVGEPNRLALRYASDGADELLFMDVVASLYGRNNLSDVIGRAADQIFIPITVGGGIRNIDDVATLLGAGADKVALNTAAVARPKLVTEIARRYGSQCVVASIEAKLLGSGRWEAYTDNGRERTGRDAIEWAAELEACGAGEILVTSVDREGTRQGFDLDLVRAISTAVGVPVIASGGLGSPRDVAAAALAGASAVAVADALHFERHSLDELRSGAEVEGLKVRRR